MDSKTSCAHVAASRPCGVNVEPRGERSSILRPVRRSNIAMFREALGWAITIRRAAAPTDPESERATSHRREGICTKSGTAQSVSISPEYVILYELTHPQFT